MNNSNNYNYNDNNSNDNLFLHSKYFNNYDNNNSDDEFKKQQDENYIDNEIESDLEIEWNKYYKIEIAKLYSNLIFYLPHSIDFRGRAYPISPYLSVVGDDLSRGLITYANGKKLGSIGWYWLRVHLANTAGYSKGKTYDERVQFTNEHINDILDSANNPLNGNYF